MSELHPLNRIILYFTVYCNTIFFTQYLVYSGHFAVNGSTAQEECLIATYMPFHGYAECFECPPGGYCPNKAMTEFFICPAGKYCGNGTYVPEDCPPGTFSDR